MILSYVGRFDAPKEYVIDAKNSNNVDDYLRLSKGPLFNTILCSTKFYWDFEFTIF